jgi:hypothetical protein
VSRSLLRFVTLLGWCLALRVAADGGMRKDDKITSLPGPMPVGLRRRLPDFGFPLDQVVVLVVLVVGWFRAVLKMRGAFRLGYGLLVLLYDPQEYVAKMLFKEFLAVKVLCDIFTDIFYLLFYFGEIFYFIFFTGNNRKQKTGSPETFRIVSVLLHPARNIVRDTGNISNVSGWME